MQSPETVRYSKEHTWIQKLNDQEGIIGITAFAQSELGEIVYADLPTPGSSFAQNEVFGSVEALKTTSDLFMPVSGEVIAINEKLASEPGLLNSDPFNEGWLIKIKILEPQDFDTLLSADDYAKLIG